MAADIDFSNARRGPALPPPKGKTRITIYIDDDVLDAFRDRAEAEGRGYQTAMNEALRRSLAATESKHEALLARLHHAIAGVLEGVKIVDAPKPRAVAKRALRGGAVSKSAKPRKR
jgi:hypothetical protein